MPEYHPYKLSEKELQFVSYLATNSTNTQRDISSSLGCSLGLTNIILKRLIKTGYIKTKQLNPKKVQYILTPKGFVEKTKKSYRYFLKTIDSIRSIKSCIKDIILEEYAKGEKNFIIIGHNELTDITEFALRDLAKSDIQYNRVSNDTSLKNMNSVILSTEESERDDKNGKCIYIFKKLSNYFG